MSLDLLPSIAGYNPQPHSDSYYFDEEAALLAIDFIENYCVHIKGKLRGKIVELQPWQRFIAAHIFGWRHKETGLRRYSTLTLGVGRKNGKSNFAAWLCVYLLFCDPEPAPEIYSAATTREQARVVFELVRDIIKQSPALLSRCKILDNASRILTPAQGGIYHAIANTAKSTWGKNTSALIFDEVFAFDSHDREFYLALDTSTGARQQPLKIQISTAGYDKESLWYREVEIGRKVARGDLIDDTLLPIIFEPSDTDNWEDPATWQKCNPNYGVSFTAESIAKRYREAKETVSREAEFRQLYLNEFTDQQTKWLPMDRWREAPRKELPSLEPGNCFAGLDLASGARDLAAFVVVAPQSDKSFHVYPTFWVPADTLREREKRDRKPYREWVDKGWLRTTPGNFVDLDAIQAYILQSASQFNLQSLAADRWNCLQLATGLTSNGIDCRLINQTFGELSEASFLLEQLVIDRRLIHNGHPILDWHAGNVQAARNTAGNIRPVRVGQNRIDGIAALVFALSRFIQSEAAQPQLIRL